MFILRVPVIFFLISMSILAFPAALFAEEAKDRETIVLDEITVIATPLESPLTVQIDPKKAMQPVPASDAADFLKVIPGFSAVRTGGTNSDPVFRGMFGSRLNILMDGSQIFGGCGGRMDSPSSYIFPEMFDAITVIKGPQSVRWGTGATAATILFDRQPPKFTTPDANFYASFLAGSYGRLEEYLSGTVGNNTMYFRIDRYDGASADYEDGDGKVIPSKWKKWSTDFAIGYTPKPTTLLELSGGGSDGEARYADRAMDGTQFKRESLNVRFLKKALAERVDELDLRVYYNHADHIMDNYNLRPSPMMKMASNPGRNLYGGRGAATFGFSDNNSLTGGFDLLVDEHIIKSDSDWSEDIRFQRYALFEESKVAVNDDNLFTSGLRLDFESAKDSRTGLTKGEKRDEWLPGAFIRFERNTESPFLFYIGVGYTERFPDYWEIRQNNVIGTTQNGFKALNTEKTLQLDAGTAYKTKRNHLWFSGYAGFVEDYILFETVGATTFVNNIEAYTWGGEAGFSTLFTDNLLFESSLAYSWGENKDTKAPLPQIPPLEGRLNLEYRAEKWQAGVIWRLVAPQNRIALEQGNIKGKDFNKSAGFGILSINGGIELLEFFTLSFGIDNILDQSYAEHLNNAGVASLGFMANEQITNLGRVYWTKLTVKY
ncbi:MAG: TonB-dependent copper receptor [Deferribacteraceae bacterium]|jgi:iron complex outermembrane receptor protein|nr:TonB-dependent copper receptor [Deferribacteraceae bacterium]